ncbi:MAG: hypothetical protein H6727_09495 [Myxococcales bacterium]|nr:hypothetical protein [Myxococcales bacterium]
MSSKTEALLLWRDLKSLVLQPRQLFHETSPSSKQLLRIMLVGLLGYAIFGLSAASLQGGRSILLMPLLFPIIFFGALCIGMPALYIFDSYLGSRLHIQHILRISLIALVLPGLLLAGMAPINWFFVVSMRSSMMVTITSGLAIAFSAILAYNQIFDLLQHLEPISSPPRETPPATRASASREFTGPPTPTKTARTGGDMPRQASTSNEEPTRPSSPPEIGEPGEAPSNFPPPRPRTSILAQTQPVRIPITPSAAQDRTQQFRQQVRYAWLLLYLGVLYKLMTLLLPLTGLT